MDNTSPQAVGNIVVYRIFNNIPTEAFIQEIAISKKEKSKNCKNYGNKKIRYFIYYFVLDYRYGNTAGESFQCFHISRETHLKSTNSMKRDYWFSFKILGFNNLQNTKYRTHYRNRIFLITDFENIAQVLIQLRFGLQIHEFEATKTDLHHKMKSIRNGCLLGHRVA